MWQRAEVRRVLRGATSEEVSVDPLPPLLHYTHIAELSEPHTPSLLAVRLKAILSLQSVRRSVQQQPPHHQSSSLFLRTRVLFHGPRRGGVASLTGREAAVFL